MSITVDIAKSQIVDSNCTPDVTTGKAELGKNPDGSMTIFGAGIFGSNDAAAAFSITLTNNIDADGSINVKSAIVGDNKSPFQITMSGTENGESSGVNSFLVDVVSKTQSSTPLFNDAPKTNESQADIDVRVYHPNENKTVLTEVKGAGENQYKTPFESDRSKSKTTMYKKDD
ncbi:MAG: hypothetical protein JNK10_05575 [Cyclobacteriaceae bacterium]|nr:hypothetical protein [Cyclobacteriaceae bacterium]